MTRTLSIGNDRLLESSLSTFDGRSAPASRKTAARPTCRRAVPCPRVPQLVRPAPRLFRRGGGRQPGNRACRSPGAHRERRAPVARSRARDLPGRRRAIPRGRRRPPNRPASAARPESGCATLTHCSLLIAHCSLLIARCSSDEGHLGRQRGGLLRVPAGAGRHARHLGGRGGVGLAGRRASGDQTPATLEKPSRAGPRVLADRDGHRRPAPLAVRRVAPREDPGALDEQPARERPSAPRDAAEPPALGARSLRGREAEVGRDLPPGREAGEVPHLGGEGEGRGEAPRPSRARARRRAAPGRGPWRSPRPRPPARRRRPRPTRRPRGPRGSPLRPGVSQSDGARPVPEVPAPAPLGPAGRRAPVPRHAVPAQDRTRALARRLADAVPGRPSPGPARAAPRPARGRPGRDGLPGQGEPRTAPPASRPSFLPGRESAGPGGLGEATGPAGVSPRAGIRAGTSPRGRPRARRGTAVGGRPPARPSPRGRFPPDVRVPGSPSSGAGAHIVVAHGWPPIPRHAR